MRDQTPAESSANPHEEIPVRVRRLGEQDGAPDNIAPLAATAAIVAVLGTTCVPMATVASMVAQGGPPQAPDADATPMGAPTTLTLLFVLVFFVISVMGIVGGIATILRRNWGRRLLLTYASLVLLYLITAVYARFRFGVGGMLETAPTGSALALHLSCVFGILLLVAALMVVILRYFTQPHVIRKFR